MKESLFYFVCGLFSTPSINRTPQYICLVHTSSLFRSTTPTLCLLCLRDVRREFVVRRYRFTTKLTKKAYKLKQILNIVTISKCKFDIYYTKFNSECCYESEKQPTDQDERTKVEGQKLLKQKNKLAITSSL
jgi:hypothetical protein